MEVNLTKIIFVKLQTITQLQNTKKKNHTLTTHLTIKKDVKTTETTEAEEMTPITKESTKIVKSKVQEYEVEIEMINELKMM